MRRQKMQPSLLRWYRRHARDLPWRRTKDPYKIWVSEIMLQQTQVATVIPYYERWMNRFPTLVSLAKAPLSEIMKYWAGLGYYRRVRMLHKGAKILMKKDFPRTTEELLKIPGIGKYTAGAIASIAYDTKAPVLDGNVIRVLTRLYAVGSDIQSPKTIAKLWKLAESLLPSKHTGDFNQALMELGAMVCIPENPRCLVCPVSGFCKAYQKGRAGRYPVKRTKDLVENIRTAALVLRQNGKVLIQKQPEKGRWGGLWMFPHWRNQKEMLKQIGKTDLRKRMAVKHGFTKYRIDLEVFEAIPRTANRRKKGAGSLPLPVPFFPNTRWTKLSALKNFAFPSPHQKIVNDLLKT